MTFTRRLLVSATALLLAVVVAISLPANAQDKSARGVAAVLQPFVDNHSLAGAITLVANKDRVLSLEAVGYSDVAARTPLKTDAIVWIASQSKPITAAALMILVDEGKVKLDEPAETYLPELKALKVKVKGGNKEELRKPARPVTLRHLLSHTSGMPFQSSAEKPTLDKLTLKEGIESYAITPLNADPGTAYAYSNAGINTAGRIIEVVSGMPYEDFLDKRLLGPLGMTDTTFWPAGEKLKRVAKAYKPDATKNGLEETRIGQLRYPLDDRTRQPMPAGGLFSTATDVARFCQMLLNGGTLNGKRVLSEAAVKEMTTRQTAKELKESYGLGLSVGGTEFGHGGALSTNMTVDTKRGLVYVWLVQHQGYPGKGGQAQGEFRRVAQAMFGTPGK